MKYILFIITTLSLAFAQSPKVAPGSLKIIPAGDYAIEMSKVQHNEIIEHYWAHMTAGLLLTEHNTVSCCIKYNDNPIKDYSYMKFMGSDHASFMGYQWTVDYRSEYETWVLTRCTVMPNACYCIIITKMAQQ